MVFLKYHWHWLISVILVVMMHSNNSICSTKPRFKRPEPKSNLDLLETKVNEIERDIDELENKVFEGTENEDDLKEKQELLKLKIDDLEQKYSAITDGNTDKMQEISNKITKLNNTHDRIESKLSHRLSKLERNAAKRRNPQAQELDRAITHRSYDLARAKLALMKDDSQLEEILTSNFRRTKDIDKILYLASTLKTNATRMLLIYTIMQRVVLDYSENKICDQIKIIDKLNNTIIDSQLNGTVLHSNKQILLAKFEADLSSSFGWEWGSGVYEAEIMYLNYLAYKVPTFLSEFNVNYSLKQIDKDEIDCSKSVLYRSYID